MPSPQPCGSLRLGLLSGLHVPPPRPPTHTGAEDDGGALGCVGGLVLSIFLLSN